MRGPAIVIPTISRTACLKIPCSRGESSRSLAAALAISASSSDASARPTLSSPGEMLWRRSASDPGGSLGRVQARDIVCNLHAFLQRDQVCKRGTTFRPLAVMAPHAAASEKGTRSSGDDRIVEFDRVSAARAPLPGTPLVMLWGLTRASSHTVSRMGGESVGEGEDADDIEPPAPLPG